jgi:hypothetical protein
VIGKSLIDTYNIWIIYKESAIFRRRFEQIRKEVSGKE